MECICFRLAALCPRLSVGFTFLGSFDVRRFDSPCQIPFFSRKKWKNVCKFLSRYSSGPGNLQRNNRQTERSRIRGDSRSVCRPGKRQRGRQEDAKVLMHPGTVDRPRFSFEMRESTCKPNSVLPCGSGGHLSGTPVARCLEQPTREVGGPRHPSPIWPCSRWGLPSHPVTRMLVRSYRTVSALPACRRRFVFCGTFLEVTLTGRYPAPCPMLFGLSSDEASLRLRPPG